VPPFSGLVSVVDKIGFKEIDTMKETNYDEHLTLIELIEKRQAVKAADFMRDVHCIINY